MTRLVWPASAVSTGNASPIASVDPTRIAPEIKCVGTVYVHPRRVVEVIWIVGRENAASMRNVSRFSAGKIPIVRTVLCVRPRVNVASMRNVG